MEIALVFLVGRQDLRARVKTYHPSLKPDAKGGGANLRPSG